MSYQNNIFPLNGSCMLLLSMILRKMLQERYAYLSHFLVQLSLLHAYLILLRVVQIVELNDERNWRSGLRVRLLSACMVTICSLYQLHMRWFGVALVFKYTYIQELAIVPQDGIYKSSICMRGFPFSI